MQIFLIGHRGTGKTALLQRLQIYGRGTLPVFDLDRELETREGLSVSEIFRTRGEEEFRRLEKRVLDHLVRAHPKMVCALGAGFRLDDYVFPPTVEIVWVRRSSDAAGRIFLDRPRLDPDRPPLDEYRERFLPREALYARHADWVYLLPEGLTAPCEFEKAIWGGRLEDIGGQLTLRPHHFRNPRVFRSRIANMGVEAFELRNDFLNEVELSMALECLAASRLLVSIRRLPVHEEWKKAAERAADVDWALELGEEPRIPVTCLSLHEALPGESFEEQARRLESRAEEGLHLKWSPEAGSFDQIDFGLRWQQADPDRRSFLPRSPEGRWSWARLLLKDRQKFNFIRDSDGSAADQPTLHEWVRALSRPRGFGAVLGSPVHHSFSPIEHLHYARHRQLDFLAVDVKAGEWPRAWPVLVEWGLRIAAVTSPLKPLAFEASKNRSPLALEFHAANTLTRSDTGFRSHNTDFSGFKEVIEGLPDLGETVIWGGGGTLPVLRKALPGAVELSARTGRPRDPAAGEVISPETLIWAAGPDAEPPAAPWRPRLVVDLNYREDSRAREYASVAGARYVSGHAMFRAQAEAQREEWESHGE